MKWLALVIAEVQKSRANTSFEVLGDYRVAHIFRDIPRLTVLPTMQWESYLRHTQTIRQDIGLAPLLHTPFNLGRGPIKFFDYSRAGAVGLYSDSQAYSETIENGVDGFLMPNDVDAWVEKIIELVDAPSIRAKMAEAAWAKVLHLGQSWTPS
jgi:glycosyltransferase involved in cell wall biosynthesis